MMMMMMMIIMMMICTTHPKMFSGGKIEYNEMGGPCSANVV